MISPDSEWYNLEIKRLQQKVAQNHAEILAKKDQGVYVKMLETDNARAYNVLRWLRASRTALDMHNDPS